MTCLQARRDARARVSARIHDMFPIMILGLIEKRFNSWLGEAPCTRIQRLFLAPDDGLGVGIHIEILAELGPWKRV